MSEKPPRKRLLMSASTKLQAQAQTQSPVQPMDGMRSSTGTTLLDTLEQLANTAKVQASQAGSGVDTKLVRAVKDIAQSWAQVHGEMRQSLQALTDEAYLAQLRALSQAMGADPPALPRAGPETGSSASTNFSPGQNSVPPLPTRLAEAALAHASPAQPRAARVDPFEIEDAQVVDLEPGDSPEGPDNE